MQFPLNRVTCTRPIMDEKASPVAADRERGIQVLGIGQGLLHSCPNRVVGILGFNDRQGNPGPEVQDIVSPLALLTSAGHPPLDPDAACRVGHLPTDLSRRIPPSRLNGRGDELIADVGLGERAKVHGMAFGSKVPRLIG